MAHASAFSYVGMGKQVTAGTPVAPTDFYRWSSLDGQPKMTIKPYRDGQHRDVVFTAKVGQWVEFKFQTYLYPSETGKLLSYTIGATDGVTGVADPYTHAGSSSDTLLANYLTFEYSQGNGQDVTRITDCIVNDLKIAGKAGDVALVDVGGVGRIGVPGTSAATVSYSTDRNLWFVDGTPVFTGPAISGADLTNLDLEIKQAVAIQPVYGTLAPQLIPGARDIMLNTLEILCVDNKFYRDLFFGSDTGTLAVVAPFSMSSLVMNWDLAGTPDHSFQLTLNNVDFTDGKATFDKDGKPFTISAKGTAKNTGSAVLQYSVKNATAAAW